jgi:tRNA (guanine-N7-)-methyltransferase
MSLNEAAERIEVVPEDYCTRMDIASLFPRMAPLEVDIGCGEGSFLVGMAASNPGRNFLGIERLLGRVRKTCRKAARLGLDNVRVLRIESTYATRWLLPPKSVDVFHVMFPDPWPKRRHQIRRLINNDFLDAVWGTLIHGGELRLSTDDAHYFEHMERVMGLRKDFGIEPWAPAEDYPQTDFERHFRARGLPIHRLLARKI